MAKYNENGGIIGPATVPTGNFGSAPGVWKLAEVEKYIKEGIWPVATTGFQVANSLRFDDGSSDYLSRTPSSETSTKIFTFSCWTKKSTNEEYLTLLSGNSSSSNNTGFFFNDTDELQFWNEISSSVNINIRTTAKFRDPSAWYHIVLALDTTQSTQSDRLKIYVNSVEQDLTISTNVSSDQVTWINDDVVQQVGGPWGQTGSSYFDGYIAEAVMIDGQQLDPTSFGETDATTGNWVPKDVSGLTFGTNGFYLDFSASGTASYVGTFNGSSQYGSIASGSITNAGTGDYTLEAFVKLDTSGNNFLIGGTGTCMQARINSSNKLDISRAGSAALTQSTGTVTLGKWTHLAWVRSGTTLTYYIDGVASGTATDTYNYTGSTLNICATNNDAASFGLDGQVNNLRFVKDAVYTSGFTPTTSNLTDITNTTLLTCQSSTFIDNSSVGSSITNNGSVAFTLDYPFNNPDIANDESGNGNDFTAINLTTGDITTDTPTNNFATWNPLNTYPANKPVLSQGNLQVVTVNADPGYWGASSTLGVSQGKWYWEVKPTNSTSGSPFLLGVSYQPEEMARNGATGASQYTASDWGYYGASGNIYNNSTNSSYGNTYTTNDIIGVALDLDNSKLYFSKNGIFQNSGDPTSGSTGTGALSITSGETYFAFVSDLGGAVCTYQANFGNPPFTISSGNTDFSGLGNFEYEVPSGYRALCTKNIGLVG